MLLPSVSGYDGLIDATEMRSVQRRLSHLSLLGSNSLYWPGIFRNRCFSRASSCESDMDRPGLLACSNTKYIRFEVGMRHGLAASGR